MVQFTPLLKIKIHLGWLFMVIKIPTLSYNIAIPFRKVILDICCTLQGALFNKFSKTVQNNPGLRYFKI